MLKGKQKNIGIHTVVLYRLARSLCSFSESKQKSVSPLIILRLNFLRPIPYKMTKRQTRIAIFDWLTWYNLTQLWQKEIYWLNSRQHVRTPSCYRPWRYMIMCTWSLSRGTHWLPARLLAKRASSLLSCRKKQHFFVYCKWKKDRVFSDTTILLSSATF